MEADFFATLGGASRPKSAETIARPDGDIDRFRYSHFAC